MFIIAKHKLVWQYPKPLDGASLPLLLAWFPLSPPAKASLFAGISSDAMLHAHSLSDSCLHTL